MKESEVTDVITVEVKVRQIAKAFMSTEKLSTGFDVGTIKYRKIFIFIIRKVFSY